MAMALASGSAAEDRPAPTPGMQTPPAQTKSWTSGGNNAGTAQKAVDGFGCCTCGATNRRQATAVHVDSKQRSSGARARTEALNNMSVAL